MIPTLKWCIKQLNCFDESPRDSCAILVNFVFVVTWNSGDSTTCPLRGRFYPRPLPSTGVTLLQQYYGRSDFQLALSIASLLHLLTDTSILRRAIGSPTFTYLPLLHAVLYDPGEAAKTCPYMGLTVLPSRLLKLSPSLIGPITGLNHFSFRLRPASFLSTLNPGRYRTRPKTRYSVWW